MKKWKRYIRNEEGSQTIEFVALFPLIIISFLFVWQMALIAYALVVTEGAARDGARAAAVDGDYNRVVERSVYGLEVTNVTRTFSEDNTEVTIRLETRLPILNIPMINQIQETITSEVTMPYEYSD